MLLVLMCSVFITSCTVPEQAHVPLPWETQLALAHDHARDVCPEAVLEGVRGGTQHLPLSLPASHHDVIRMTFNFRCPGHQWIHVQFDDTHQHVEVLSSPPFDNADSDPVTQGFSQYQLTLVEQYVQITPRQAIQLTLDEGYQFAETYAQDLTDVEVTAALDVEEHLEEVIGTPAAWSVFYTTRVKGKRNVLLVTVNARTGSILSTYSE